MQASCYILYSMTIDRYYVGSTHDPIEARLEKHNTGFYEDKWTRHGIPWELFLVINCETLEQARRIEKHVKEMKSRAYIENLKRYREMVTKLKIRFSEPDS